MLQRKVREPYSAHESVYIDHPCAIGEGTTIWHFSHVMQDAQIGRNCTIGQNVFIASNVRIGDNVKIQNNVSVYQGVELEDEVFCGPSIVFTNVVTPRSGTPRSGSRHYLRTLVRRGATIGANATILCGTTIGAFAFIGAGSVVTKDVPDYALVYGNPARIQGYACECGVRLNFSDETARCRTCGRVFRIAENVVRYVSS